MPNHTKKSSTTFKLEYVPQRVYIPLGLLFPKLYGEV